MALKWKYVFTSFDKASGKRFRVESREDKFVATSQSIHSDELRILGEDFGSGEDAKNACEKDASESEMATQTQKPQKPQRPQQANRK